MVEIDVRRCLNRKEYGGELSFSFEAGNDLIDIPFVAFSSPVKALLRYEIFGNGEVSVTGTVAFSLKGACSRCLSEIEREFTGEADALFVPGKGDGVDYGYTGGRVNLEEALRDAVLTALPQRLECEEECKLPEWDENKER